MASNTRSSNTAVLLRLKQYKMENPVEQSCSTEQKPILETSWEDFKNSCTRREPSTKRSK